MNYTIDIICPIYNAEKYILNLDNSIRRQKNVKYSMHYILTESNDNTEQILIDNKINYEKIKKEDFSHSLTREIAAKKCNADIIVFISQDIIIKRDDWLVNLTIPIANGECEASYSRQIAKNKGIEEYAREKNYPDKSFIKTKNDIKKNGLNTFFFSDASSAISNKIFKELNYYDGKNLQTNEDMYIAYKLITNNYRIKYVANSEIFHSHNTSLKQIYQAYYRTGLFFSENKYLNMYGTNSVGVSFALYILKRIIQDCNIKELFRFLPNMVARFLGIKISILRNRGKINKGEINESS